MLCTGSDRTRTTQISETSIVNGLDRDGIPWWNYGLHFFFVWNPTRSKEFTQFACRKPEIMYGKRFFSIMAVGAISKWLHCECHLFPFMIRLVPFAPRKHPHSEIAIPFQSPSRTYDIWSHFFSDKEQYQVRMSPISYCLVEEKKLNRWGPDPVRK